MNITHKVHIDLAFAPSGLALPIKVMQGDVHSRSISFALTSNGEAWTVPEDIQVCIGYQRADETLGIYDAMPDGTRAWSADGNVITVEIAPQVMAQPGEVEMAVSLLSGEAVISTFPVHIYVQALPGYDGAEEEWIATTKGEKGDKGDRGEKGNTGKSAYQYAVDGGYTGTEAEFAAEIKALPDAAERIDHYVDTVTQVVSEIREAVTAAEEAPPIICHVSGEVITVADTSDRLLRGLKLYGKTTQNGTPTPEAPVELVSAGASGAINTTVCGKNLVDVFNTNMNLGRSGARYDGSSYEHRDYINKVAADGTVSVDISGTVTYGLGFTKKLLKGQTVTISFDVLSAGTSGTGLSFNVYDTANYSSYKLRKVATTTGMCSATFTADADSTYQFGWYVGSGTMPCGAQFNNLQLEVGSVATEYEPYKSNQTLTANTPNGLPGIPVSEGGNYTDANGQQWICDELDFARGKYVQRICKLVMDGRMNSFTRRSTSAANSYVHYLKVDDIGITGFSASTKYPILCTHGPTISKREAGDKGMVGATIIDHDESYENYCLGFSFGLVEEFDSFTKANSWLSTQYDNGNPLIFLYVLAEPIETDLSVEELTAYAAIHTNKPNTTVYNDAGAYMEMTYVADTKLYIDNKLAISNNTVQTSTEME
ncbi:MAG: hypothetical protein IKY59_03015 [Oscillospiraceae bacterium]|nr:hypothetical protein [Oscillospiraceae bacterium]